MRRMPYLRMQSCGREPAHMSAGKLPHASSMQCAALQFCDVSGRPCMSETSVARLTCAAWQRGTPALLRLVSSYSVSMPNQHMPRWHACVYLLHWTTARQVLPTRMFTNAPQSRQLVSCKAWGSTSQGPPRHTIYTLLPPAAAASNPQRPLHGSLLPRCRAPPRRCPSLGLAVCNCCKAPGLAPRTLRSLSARR